MAYMNQNRKAIIKQNLDKICKPLGIKYSLSVRSGMTICMTLKSAPIDFIGNCNDSMREPSHVYYGKNISFSEYLQVNPYHFKNQFSGKALEIITKIFEALYSAGWYDRSDAQTDYFDTAYYIDLDIGSWNKPFEVK